MRMFLLLILLTAVSAFGDQITRYDINFQVATVIPPNTHGLPTGSFSYDSTIPSFTSVNLDYAGVNFILNFNSPTFESGDFCNGVSGPALGFDILDQQCPAVPGFPTKFGISPLGGTMSGMYPLIQVIYGDDYVDFEGYGTSNSVDFSPIWGTLSITAVPEPATTLPTLLSGALLALCMKRLRRSLGHVPITTFR
jgi:hypothetical protein